MRYNKTMYANQNAHTACESASAVRETFDEILDSAFDKVWQVKARGTIERIKFLQSRLVRIESELSILQAAPDQEKA